MQPSTKSSLISMFKSMEFKGYVRFFTHFIKLWYSMSILWGLESEYGHFFLPLSFTLQYWMLYYNYTMGFGGKHLFCGVSLQPHKSKYNLRPDVAITQYLRGVQSSYGGMMTTFTVTDVLRRSIICSWLRVATATLQISTSRLPCRSPACHA